MMRSFLILTKNNNCFYFLKDEIEALEIAYEEELKQVTKFLFIIYF